MQSSSAKMTNCVDIAEFARLTAQEFKAILDVGMFYGATTLAAGFFAGFVAARVIPFRALLILLRLRRHKTRISEA